MIWRLAALLLGIVSGQHGRGGSSPQPRTHTIEIRGMAFHPDVVTVAPGDTVVWINRDIVPHTATAARKIKWDTGSLAQGAEGRFVPMRAGTVSYSCTFHPTMQGRLIVR